MADLTTTHRIAKEFYALLEADQYMKATEDFYADDAVHVEPMAMPGMSPITEGKAEILARSRAWAEDTTVHGNQLAGPLSHGDQFSVYMKMDVSMKSMGDQRMTLEEVCLYTLKDGKIARVEFFYAPMDC